MRKSLLLLLLLTIGVNFYFATFSVLHGEINFFNDVARDFLLLQELAEKQIILIGPRAGVAGLFHGPVWSYLTYPFFLLGNGNPLVVAWFWLGLAAFSLVTSFLLIKKFFGTFSALAYVAIFSSRIIPHVNGVMHAEAVIYFMPWSFFSIVLYAQSKKLRYLVMHLYVAMLLVQLDIGIGIPLLILSLTLITWFLLRSQQWKHFLALLIVPLPLANFFIFDLRHNFRMTKVALKYIQDQRFAPTYKYRLQDRLNWTTDLQLIPADDRRLTVAIFALTMFFTLLRLRQSHKYRQIYLLFLWYFFGYMLLTFVNKGVILFHFVFPLMPLTAFWFASFLESKYKIVFLTLLLFISILNF